MSEITWQDPPLSKHGGRGRWETELLSLIDHPKRWALMRSFDSAQTAYNAQRNLSRGFYRLPPDTLAEQWEFAARKNDSGRGDLYARYLGDLPEGE